MKYLLPILALLVLVLGGATEAFALSTFATVQGGTGTTSPSGILYGDNGATNHLNTATIGSGLSFTGGTLSATGGSGGTGTVSTSTHEVANQIPIWTSNSGTPALLGQITNTTNGFVLGLSGGVPTWLATTTLSTISGLLNAATQITGILPYANGGTGTTTAPVGQLLYGGSTAYQSVGTTTVSCSGAAACTQFTILGNTPVTITGTNTTYTAAWPITLAGTVFGFGGLSTTTNLTQGQIPYVTGVNTLGQVATSSLAVNASLSSSGTLGSQIGGTNTTLSLNLANSNTFTALQQFNGNASTTGFTNSGSEWLTALGVPAGSFLAVDPNGKIIATTSPSGGGGSGTVGSGTIGQFPYYAANGTTLTATSSIFINSSTGNIGIATTSVSANTPLEVALGAGSGSRLLIDFPIGTSQFYKNFGFNNEGNGTVDFGQFGGTYLSWDYSGNGALHGTWSFPANAAYPSPLLGFASGGAGATGLRLETSGTGSNKTVYAYTSDYAGSGQAPNLSFAANGFTFGINNCFLLSYSNCVVGGGSTPVLTIASSTGFVGIGTTTPTAELVTVAASTTAGTVQTSYNGVVNIIAGLENTTTKLFQVIDQWGSMYTSGDTPSVSGGTSSVAGNQRNGLITVTGTALTSVTLTFAHPWLVAPDCTTSDNSLTFQSDPSSISTTQLVIGFTAGVTSANVWYICQAHQ